jgi:adenylosuccinate lyase
MPHKRNPIVSEQICGLARLLRANAGAALENIALWHERDISHSSIERVILPDSCIIVDYLLARTTWLVDGLDVDVAQMARNVEQHRVAIASQRVLLVLIQHGWTRDDAWRAVHAAVDAAQAGETSLADALAAHVDARQVDLVSALERASDAAAVPRGVADIMRELERASSLND